MSASRVIRATVVSISPEPPAPVIVIGVPAPKIEYQPVIEIQGATTVYAPTCKIDTRKE